MAITNPFTRKPTMAEQIAARLPNPLQRREEHPVRRLINHLMSPPAPLRGTRHTWFHFDHDDLCHSLLFHLLIGLLLASMIWYALLSASAYSLAFNTHLRLT